MKKKPASRKKPSADSRRNLERAALAARAHIFQSVDALLEVFIGEAAVLKLERFSQESDQVALHESYERLRTASRLLMLWHSDDQFLMPDGSPKPLRKNGKASLATLAKALSDPSGGRRDQLLADLIDFDLVTRHGAFYLPTKRAAIVGEASALILAHATAAITRLLNTVAHNVSGRTPPRYERHVADVRIHSTDLPVFLRFVEQQGQYLIDSVDDWLSKREIKGPSREKEVTVGIGAYAWIDPPRISVSQLSPRGGAIVPRK